MTFSSASLKSLEASLLGGLYYTAQSFRGSQRNVELAQQTLTHAQRSQDHDRFFKATEQLGNQNADVRAGALYALGMLANDSNDHYQQAMETVLQYIRGNTALNTITEPTKSLGARRDIQAAIHVLSRRKPHPSSGKRKAVDLHGLHLEGYEFRGGWYVESDFSGSSLMGSNFSGAVLHGSHFIGSNCTGCHFDGAGLINVLFVDATLDHATFYNLLPNQRQRLFNAIESPYSRLAFLYDEE